jgi:hypothetical protein
VLIWQNARISIILDGDFSTGIGFHVNTTEIGTSCLRGCDGVIAFGQATNLRATPLNAHGPFWTVDGCDFAKPTVADLTTYHFT